MEDKNRTCGTAILWEIMANMTPEEIEEFEKKIEENIKQSDDDIFV